ncbi:MAG: hypothetical protein H6672_22540 [Anaerolineaceae bacterium]|nr:hypothetical protein [Anaerolineaceae bacterium]
MTETIFIESQVPFGRTLHNCLYIKGTTLDNIIQHDQVETHYLAWETVRKQVNPFFRNGTGFEGYVIGQCANSEAALETILEINQSILDAIARLYHGQYRFHSRLMKTLTRETCDIEALHIWSAYLGAELGKLRAQSLENIEAQLFRRNTYALVKKLPPISYHDVGNAVLQVYGVGVSDKPVQKLLILPEMLNPTQQEAWIVAQTIGEFGHPLIRQNLDRTA